MIPHGNPLNSNGVALHLGDFGRFVKTTGADRVVVSTPMLMDVVIFDVAW